jgi:hypothetical protein
MGGLFSLLVKMVVYLPILGLVVVYLPQTSGG